MKIEILGTGCPKCNALTKKVESIANMQEIKIELTKITDINHILEYGVMMTPALVINGEVKATGKIPNDDQILKWLS